MKLILFSLLIFSFVACTKPALPGSGGGGSLGDTLRDGQSPGDEKGESEATPVPRKEK